MEMEKVGFLTDARYLEHDPGKGHPESPSRLTAIYKRLIETGLWGKLVHIAPEFISQDDLFAVHSPDYVELVCRETAAGKTALSTGTGDANICLKSFEIALLSAGGAIRAVDAVCTGEVNSVFCAIRPPGHHATVSEGMGFCIFNNAALAAKHAQKVHGLERILIVDWDFHHGNGTQEIFYEDPTVFYFSTHQLGRYPMPSTHLGYEDQIGEGAGKGTNINCPLPKGSGDEEIIGAFMERLVPAMKDFSPELIIISAGFDSRQDDPIGEFNLTDNGFSHLTNIVIDIAKSSANGRIVSLLEGGYNLAGLSAAVTAHIETLLQDA